MYWTTFLIGYRHILVRFVFVKPRAVRPIFCLIVQNDYYNAHPRHFADELPDCPGWIHVRIGKCSRADFLFVSSFRIFPTFIKWDIVSVSIFTEMRPWSHILKHDLAGFIRGYQVIRTISAEGGRCNNQFARSSKRSEAQRGFTNTKLNRNISLSD